MTVTMTMTMGMATAKTMAMRLAENEYSTHLCKHAQEGGTQSASRRNVRVLKFEAIT